MRDPRILLMFDERLQHFFVFPCFGIKEQNDDHSGFFFHGAHSCCGTGTPPHAAVCTIYSLSPSVLYSCWCGSMTHKLLSCPLSMWWMQLSLLATGICI
jgi:hypothetical protein